jgi:hypothetical protein
MISLKAMISNAILFWQNLPIKMTARKEPDQLVRITAKGSDDGSRCKFVRNIVVYDYGLADASHVFGLFASFI